MYYIRKREKKREREKECVRERERKRVCERERKSVRERERIPPSSHWLPHRLQNFEFCGRDSPHLPHNTEGGVEGDRD